MNKPKNREEKRQMPPVHPGEYLREDIVKEMGVSKTDLAKILGITRQHLDPILKGEARLTPVVAARLAKFLGGDAGIWLRQQATWDAQHERA